MVNLCVGVFADDMKGSSDEDGPQLSAKRQKKSGGKNYSAPMNFVAGGVKQGDKVVKDNGDDAKSDEVILFKI